MARVSGKLLRAAGTALLLAGVGLSTPVAAQDEPAATPAPEKLCPFDPADFGIELLVGTPLEETRKADRKYYLRAKFLRLQGRAQAEFPISYAIPKALGYQDVVIFYHVPESEAGPSLTKAIDGVAKGKISASFDCDFRNGKTLDFYDPFTRLDGTGVGISAATLVFSRGVTVSMTAEKEAFRPLVPEEDAIADLLAALEKEPQPSNPLAPVDVVPPMAEPPPEPEPEPKTWQRNYYAWIIDLDFAAAPGEEVFAPDRVECRNNSNFIVGAVGTMATPEQKAPSSDEVVPVVRNEMIAANIYFGASGTPEDVATTESSVDSGHYWCIPKKETCYQPVPFGDFQIRAKQGDISEFKKQSVVSMRHGLVKALQRVIMDNCPQQVVAANGK